MKMSDVEYMRVLNIPYPLGCYTVRLFNYLGYIWEAHITNKPASRDIVGEKI